MSCAHPAAHLACRFCPCSLLLACFKHALCPAVFQPQPATTYTGPPTTCQYVSVHIAPSRRPRGNTSNQHRTTDQGHGLLDSCASPNVIRATQPSRQPRSSRQPPEPAHAAARYLNLDYERQGAASPPSTLAAVSGYSGLIGETTCGTCRAWLFGSVVALAVPVLPGEDTISLTCA